MGVLFAENIQRLMGLVTGRLDFYWMKLGSSFAQLLLSLSLI